MKKCIEKNKKIRIQMRSCVNIILDILCPYVYMLFIKKAILQNLSCTNPSRPFHVDYYLLVAKDF